MSDDENNKMGEQLSGDSPLKPVLEDKPRPPRSATPTTTPSTSPDDMEEALTWLEQLAAKQGVSVDELSSRYPDAIELSFPELGLAQADELPEWLKEVPPAHRLREFPSSAGAAAALDDVPEWLLSEPPTTNLNQEQETKDLSSELDSRLDWLAEMGKKDEMAEMPTVRWRPDDDLGLPGQPIPSWNEAEMGQATGQVDSFAEIRGDAPEDLDQAMAWLEELATSQDTPLEELPSVADRILASRIMAESGLELEEEPHVASLFNPTFLAATFADLDSAGSLDAGLDAELDAEPIELANFPDDLNEAMDYLDKLAAVRQRSEAQVVPGIPVVPEIPGVPEILDVAELPPPDEVGLAADEITTDGLMIEAEASVIDEMTTDETADDFVDEVDVPTTDEVTADESPLEAAALAAADEMTSNETADDLTVEADAPPAADDVIVEDVGLVATDEVTADELVLELETEAVAADEFDEQLEEEAIVLLAASDFDTTADSDELELEPGADFDDDIDDEMDDVVLEADTSPTLFEDPLEMALTNLDQLSLPPTITLESLNEALLNGHAPGLNGHNGYDDDDQDSYDDPNDFNAYDLDGTLLWLEQQLDSPMLFAPVNTSAEVAPELDERPNELLLELATLDEAVVAELTADMPDDPDEALTWLMSLADEVEEPQTQPEMEVYTSPAIRRGVRVYDVAEQPVVEESVAEEPLMEQSEAELSVTDQVLLEAPTVMPVEAARPELVSLAADDLPEMPDDPDEAIAWIEKLAAMEAAGSRGAGEQRSGGAGETGRLETRDVEILAGESSPSTIAGEGALQSSLDYSPFTSVDESKDLEDIDNTEEDQLGEWDEVLASIEVTSMMELEDSEVEESEELPEPADEPEPQERQPITRQPHERWLDMLQPPPWTQKG